MKKKRYYGSEEFLEEKERILEIFHFKCIRCFKPTNIVHEIKSRGASGKEAFNFENRAPLCSECHDWAHSLGFGVVGPILTKLRSEALERYVN